MACTSQAESPWDAWLRLTKLAPSRRNRRRSVNVQHAFSQFALKNEPVWDDELYYIFIIFQRLSGRFSLSNRSRNIATAKRWVGRERPTYTILAACFARIPTSFVIWFPSNWLDKVPVSYCDQKEVSMYRVAVCVCPFTEWTLPMSIFISWSE